MVILRCSDPMQNIRNPSDEFEKNNNNVFVLFWIDHWSDKTSVQHVQRDFDKGK